MNNLASLCLGIERYCDFCNQAKFSQTWKWQCRDYLQTIDFQYIWIIQLWSLSESSLNRKAQIYSTPICRSRSKLDKGTQRGNCKWELKSRFMAHARNIQSWDYKLSLSSNNILIGYTQQSAPSFALETILGNHLDFWLKCKLLKTMTWVILRKGAAGKSRLILKKLSWG